MADVTSLKPPTLLPNKHVESYSPKGPENVKISTLYGCTWRPFSHVVGFGMLRLNYVVDKYQVTREVPCVFTFVKGLY